MSRGNDVRSGHEGGDDGSDTPLEKSAVTKRKLNGWKCVSNGDNTSRRKEEGRRGGGRKREMKEEDEEEEEGNRVQREDCRSVLSGSDCRRARGDSKTEREGRSKRSKTKNRKL